METQTTPPPNTTQPARDAARLVAIAIDHVERAAVGLATALDHVPHANVPTDGTRLILEGTRDDLRRHREALLIEHVVLVDAYAHALRRAGAQR